jgi:exo-1,4-beta-D-glucosaminidase
MRLAPLTLALLIAAHAAAQTLPLDRDWHLQSGAAVESGGEVLSTPDFTPADWHPTVVPRTVLAALVDNGVYPDPYHGLNLKQIPGYRDGLWLAMPEDSPFRRPWWYQTRFTVPADWAGRHITLHLDGVNYEANVWLNGKRIADRGTVRGMFRRFEFVVTDGIQPGRANALAIEVISPGQIPDKDYGTKQVEATTGWDDHNPQPPDLNMGLWERVYLKAQGPVSLRHAYAESEIHWDAADHATRADITLSAHLQNLTDAPVSGVLRGAINGVTVETPVALAAGEQREVFLRPAELSALRMEAPRLWWPHPVGEPALHDAALAFLVDGIESDSDAWRFGIREITTHINEEDWRGYRVNRKDILIRGGAWMTADMLLRLTPERYEALIRYAREANLNMLRSEGFSIRESETFYRLCDEMGVMVTQQIFGRSIPDEDLAIACIDDMLLRIRRHPSLAHLLGHDETFPTERLDAAYREMIGRHRVARTYQPHSGTFTVPTRAATGGTRTGTRELWTYSSPAHYYHRKFDGAWGFAQSGGIGGIVAAPDSIRQMLPEDQRWPALDTEAWSFHTVTQGGDYFDAVRVAMNEGFGPAHDLDDFLRKAYAMNYASAQGMFEAYARNKYDALGITTWKYNAAWPAAMTWQYIDWYLRPTAAYYGAKTACQALHVLYAYDDECVHLVNSRYEGAGDLTVSATFHDVVGTVLAQAEAPAAVGPDGVAKIFAAPWPAPRPALSFLTLQARDASGAVVARNRYWLSATPDIPGNSGQHRDGVFRTRPKSRGDFRALEALPPVELAVEAAHARDAGPDRRVRVRLHNPGGAAAFMAYLALRSAGGEPEIAPVYWEDNYVTLLPGESREIIATVPAGIELAVSPVVGVSGWNVAPRAIEVGPAP